MASATARASAKVIDDQSAGHWPGDRREPHECADEAHTAPALTWGHDVTHDGLRADHQSATANSLQSAEDQKFCHRPRGPARGRPEQEDHYGELEDRFTAERVPGLAIDWQSGENHQCLAAAHATGNVPPRSGGGVCHNTSTVS
jgi:hypothetical protein